MLNLSELKFNVNTEALIKAKNAIDELVKAQKRLGGAANDTDDDLVNTEKNLDKLGKGSGRTTAQLKGMERVLERQATKMAILTGASVKLADGQSTLDRVFSAGQAGMLASAKVAGATKGQFEQLAGSIQQLISITGTNKFDESTSGLHKLSKEVDELGRSYNNTTGAVRLTAQESRDLSRDTAALKILLDKNKISTQQYDLAVNGLTQSYVNFSQEKAQMIQQSKLAEEQIRREAQAQTKAASLMGNEMVAMYRQRQAAAKQAADAEIAEEKRLAQFRKYVWADYAKNVGKDVEANSNAWREYFTRQGTLEKPGRTAVKLSEQPMDASVSLFYKERALQARDLAKAEKFLATEMQRVDSILTELNREHASGSILSEKHATAVSRFANQLKLAGVSGTTAAAQLEQYRGKMQQIEAIENRRAQNRLANALAPQISDVAVSIAGGMPLHLVIMQQGLQIRDLIGQSGVAAEHLQKTMRDAMKNMVTSIGGTIAALGTMTFGALADAGKGVVGFASKISGTSNILEKLRLDLTLGAMEGDVFSKRILGIGRALGTLTTAIAATGIGLLVIALSVATYEFIKLIGANNKLVRELAVTGNVFGVTTASSLQYVEGLTKVGATTREAISIIGEMSKAGNLSRAQIDLVGKSAVDMQRAAGVAIEDTVKRFSDLAKDPVKALSTLQIQTGAVQPEIIKLVEELTKQGDSAKASGVAVEELARIVGGQTSKMVEDLHPLTLAWEGFKKLVSEVWTGIGNLINRAMGNIPEQQKLMERMAKRQKEIQSTQENLSMLGSFGKNDWLVQLQQEQAADSRRLMMIDKAAQAELDRSQQRVEDEKRRTKANKLELEYLDTAKRKTNELAQLEKDREFLAAEGKPMTDAAYEEAKKKILDAGKSKGASKAENYFAKLMQEATNNTIAADNATKDLTKSELKLLEVRSDPRFLGLPADQQKQIAAKYQTAIASEKEAESLKKVIEAEEFRLEVLGLSQGIGKQYYERVDALEKHAIAAGWTREQIEEMTRAIFNQTPAMREYNKAVEETAAAAAKFAEESRTAQADIAKQNLDYDFRLSLLGKTTEEQRLLTIEHERSNAILDVENKLLETQRQIKEKIRVAELSGADISALVAQELQAKKDAADKITAINRGVAVSFAEDMQRSLEEMRDGIADSITTALFEGGKAGSTKLRQVIVNELKKPVVLMVQAVVNTLLGSVFGGGGGAVSSLPGGGSGGGLSSLFSGISSMKDIGSILSGGMSAIGSTIANLGTTTISNVVGALGGDAVGTLAALKGGGSSAMASLGSAANLLGGAAAGFVIGKMISGGYSAIGKSGNAAVALGTGAGALLGMKIGTLGGPLGAFIGGLVGGAVNLLFGRKLKDTGIEGTFSGADQFSGNSYEFYKGGLFRSDKTKRKALDAETTDALGEAFKAVRDGILDMTGALGLGAEALDGYTRSIKISTKGMNEQQVQEAWAKEFTAISEEMAQRFMGTFETTLMSGFMGSMLGRTTTEWKPGEFVREGETALVALTRLSTAIKVVNPMLDVLGLSMYQVSLAGADMSSQLVDLFGNAETMLGLTTAYYQNYYSEAERTAKATEQMTTALQTLGINTLPMSRDAYRELVESQDLTTESGRKMFAELMKLAPAFSELTAAMSEVTNGVIEEVRRLRGEIYGSSAATLGAQFAIATAAARAGDSNAMAQLPALSQALEETARLNAVTAADLAISRARLAASLTETLATQGIGVPAFASGGMYGGGLALVGERGPELINFNNGGRVHNSTETMQMLNSRSSEKGVLQSVVRELISEMRKSNTETTMMRAETKATALNTSKMTRLLERVTRDGESLQVTNV